MAVLVREFDFWKAGYSGASVSVYDVGTSNLSSLFTDEALSVAAANPQTLDSKTVNGIGFGKFAAPLYVSGGYYIIVGADQSGNYRAPLTTLVASDVSKAVATVFNGSVARELEDMFSVRVDVRDFGVFKSNSEPGYSGATNAATLAAAIGAVTTLGGGHVEIPAGTYTITTASLAARIQLRGKGRGSTTMQSTQGAAVFTIAGDKAGFVSMTLDGVSLQAGSKGVYGENKNEIIFRDVEVKRFETGLHFQGGQRSNWEDLYIEDCTNGAKLHGDLNTGGDSGGGVWKYNKWTGGRVTNCTTLGVEIKYVDQQTYHNTLSHVGFQTNTGTALHIMGARWTQLNDACWFVGNTKALDIEDGTDPSAADENTVVGFHMTGGQLDDDCDFDGRCEDVVLDGVQISSGTMTLTNMANAILALDCVTDPSVTIAGASSIYWTEAMTTLGDSPGSFGTTTDATATVAWEYQLSPGEVVNIEARVVARSINTAEYSSYHIARSARRPGSTLAYQAQTANFTLGETLTGATSGATAVIVADTDAGATGTLTLIKIDGAFQNGETITDGGGGSAQANGTLSAQNAALLGSTTSLQAAIESDAASACDFTVSSGYVRVTVTGVAAKSYEWTTSVSVVSSE